MFSGNLVLIDKVHHTLKMNGKTNNSKIESFHRTTRKNFKSYTRQSKKPLFLLLIFSLLIINASSIWNFFILKSNYDSMNSRFDTVISLTSSSGAVSFAGAILYAKILNLKGNRANSIEEAKADVFIFDSLLDHVLKAMIIRENKVFASIADKHICDIAAQSFISENVEKLYKSAMTRCIEIVPDKHSFTLFQAMNHIIFIIKDIRMLIDSNSVDALDAFVLSNDFQYFDELIFYYACAVRYTSSIIVTQISSKAYSSGTWVSFNSQLLILVLVLFCIFYKIIYFPARLQHWKKLKYSLLALNDSLISSPEIKVLMK